MAFDPPTVRAAALAAALVTAACDRAPPPPAAPQPPKEIAVGKPQKGEASYYGREFAGKETASGETFRTDAMTAASRTLPLGSKVRVTNTETGQSARLTINDRGPYAKGRVLDVTPKAARHIGLEKKEGTADVRIQPVAVRETTAAP